MNVIITPHTLQGTVEAPSSKASATATSSAPPWQKEKAWLTTFPCPRTLKRRATLTVFGGKHHAGHVCLIRPGGLPRQVGRRNRLGLSQSVPMKSGLMLRFLIPVAILSGNEVTFSGQGRLAKRPLTPYYELFDEKGVAYETTEGALPLTVSGTLQPGTYSLAGDVSSQFFTGLP